MSPRPRHKILFVQSSIQAHGGVTAVFTWMLQALVSDYDVTILTWNPVDPGALNRQYGAYLETTHLRVRRPPAAWRRAADFLDLFDRGSGSFQRTILLMRYARRIAAEFHLLIGCEMECDLGGRGLQYIHFPWLAKLYPHLAFADRMGTRQKTLALLQGRLRPWQWIGDFSFERMRSNRTLTNSDWTGTLVRRAFTIDTTTLYPPASGLVNDVPWSERSNGFLVVGRVHPEKRIDWLIETMAPLRSAIPDLHLHLVGTIGNSPRGEDTYLSDLQPLLEQHHDWVTLYLDLPRSELARLAGRQRYGVHAMIDEHFGIAIAEIVAAGGIPFLHRSGGAIEIVECDPALTYADGEELRERILAVVQSAERQQQIRARLAAGVHRFEPQHFMHRFRECVEQECVRDARSSI